MDWDTFDPSSLFAQIRERFLGHEAEQMVWAFEKALDAARIDDRLLDYLLVAAACLLARGQHGTPREVFEQYFRRSVSDEEWRERYAPLLG